MMKFYHHSILAYAFLTITFQLHHPCLSTTVADDQTTLVILKTRITSDPCRNKLDQLEPRLQLDRRHLQLGRLSFLDELSLLHRLEFLSFTGSIPTSLSNLTNFFQFSRFRKSLGGFRVCNICGLNRIVYTISHIQHV